MQRTGEELLQIAADVENVRGIHGAMGGMSKEQSVGGTGLFVLSGAADVSSSPTRKDFLLPKAKATDDDATTLRRYAPPLPRPPPPAPPAMPSVILDDPYSLATFTTTIPASLDHHLCHVACVPADVSPASSAISDADSAVESNLVAVTVQGEGVDLYNVCWAILSASGSRQRMCLD